MGNGILGLVGSTCVTLLNVFLPWLFSQLSSLQAELILRWINGILKVATFMWCIFLLADIIYFIEYRTLITGARLWMDGLAVWSFFHFACYSNHLEKGR